MGDLNQSPQIQEPVTSLSKQVIHSTVAFRFETSLNKINVLSEMPDRGIRILKKFFFPLAAWLWGEEGPVDSVS